MTDNAFGNERAAYLEGRIARAGTWRCLGPGEPAL